MVELPSVTLVCIDCETEYRAIRVLEHCKTQCQFGAVKFLTSIHTPYPHIEIAPILAANRVLGLALYSEFVLRRLYEFIDTEHLLIVQHDGWILDSSKWDPGWMQYDYIGPLYLQHPDVGSGGFSFRSKKLMKRVSEIVPPLKNWQLGTSGYCHEDGYISYAARKELEAAGCKFPSPEVAARFAYGGNKAHYCPTPFGFHGFYALDTLLGGKGDPIPRAPEIQ